MWAAMMKPKQFQTMAHSTVSVPTPASPALQLINHRSVLRENNGTVGSDKPSEISFLDVGVCLRRSSELRRNDVVLRAFRFELVCNVGASCDRFAS